jgi:tetratricopeptide (TPR) repeat protein
MKTWIATTAACTLFAAGLGVGMAAQPRNAAASYHDQAPRDAAQALLGNARAQAGSGSWELIAVGRVFYLGGFRQQGQAIFDQLLSGEHEDSDELRIARVYREANEWEKARPLFAGYAMRNPKDRTEIAEIGAYYLLQGDRAAAEKLFDQSFAGKPELWATVAAAGAYLGVAPQP